MNYENGFKEEALKLSDEIGPKKTAEQLGLKVSTIAGWRKERARKERKEKLEKIEPMTEREMLLFKENAELKEANRILKDALCFFAKGQKV